jgi:hypothetical protein
MTVNGEQGNAPKNVTIVVRTAKRNTEDNLSKMCKTLIQSSIKQLTKVKETG